MDNVVLTSASQISPNAGHPLNPEPIPSLAFEAQTTSTIEALVSTPLEPVEQSDVDGNFQAHVDVNYQAHDVALATATVVPQPDKSNGYQQTNGCKLSEHHKMEIDDGYEHPDKVKSCCSMLNKLFLALAIVCFALFLCSIAFIVANLDGLNGKNDGRGLSRIPYPYQVVDSFASTDRSLNDPYFNLTHSNKNGIIVVLARRGASIENILIPYVDKSGMKQYRSIVLKGDNRTHFGSIRFGFDEEMNLTNQLPLNYPYFNAHDQDWSMFADTNKPSRVRFVNSLMEVIYDFSSSNNNELTMTTIVSTPVNQQLIVDPTNNIYFNLRGYGSLNSHYFNMSSSSPINIKTGDRIEQDRIISDRPVDQWNNVHNYFFKLDRAGLGKNYVGTLAENETKTLMHIFADHAGVIIDPTGVVRSNGVANMSDIYGIRISPRQSPSYQPKSIYGSTLVVHPSQAIHTTWWQFEY